MGETYYEAVGKTVCERCKRQIEWHLAEGAGFAGFLKALAFGSIGGALGALLWYAVRSMGYEAALVAIALGWLVGRGVNLGTGGRGGLGFQVLAVLLTYTAIAFQWLPDIWGAINQSKNLQGAERLVALVLAVPFTFAAPFLGGWQSILSILIIGFGLWQAWKMNARPTVAFSGPFRVGAAPAVPAPPA